MSESIQEVQDQIVEDFSVFDDWMDRYRFLIDLGRSLPPYPEHLKTDEWRVKGCINRAWLHGEARDGRVYYQACSESEIVAGLIALLLKVYSGRSPQEIVETSPDFLQRIGVWENITSNRITGLNGMIALIQNVAKAELKAA
ncbi:SufE family protein [uncultured Ferrovibrio sp.]|jgi:cysteine desulfuration protein SufE|uniref:SufE family protein n=1 Tax=uncultured Ferrovibrio sp. TaxID=1576913 RepID=UPI002602474F|nr:SufE family protein [uncultured Ferrovibrio sp.]